MIANCLLIDHDEASLQELAGLLGRHPLAGGVHSVKNLAAARSILAGDRAAAGTDQRAGERAAGRIDILFLHFKDWDQYRKIVPPLISPPPIIVFLSGRKEHSTLRLEKEVDFYLPAPYRAAAINRLFARIGDPSFAPRGLDFFFLKADRQYYTIAFSALREVSSKGRMLTVRTDKAEYQVSGSLSGMQERLPPLFCRVGPSLLVAGRELMGGYYPVRAANLFAPY